MGDVIQIQFDPNQGGDDVDMSRALSWMGDRFAGKPAANDCGTLTATTEPSQAGG